MRDYEHHGVTLVTRKKFALHLDGTSIDFKDGPMGRGFAIVNPNYSSGGGCPAAAGIKRVVCCMRCRPERWPHGKNR